jgi:hypothetical protein
MAFYRDKVQRVGLIDKLVQLLTTAPAGATEPYWKQVQSGTFQNEGYILHSKGKSGTDNIYIRFLKPDHQNSIEMTMIEEYTPNSVAGLNGTIVNESFAQRIYFYNNRGTNGDYNNWGGGYPSNAPVHYFLSFDKDKIMLSLRGDSLVSDTVSTRTFAWIGLPNRLSTEADSTACAHAVSSWAYRLTNAGSSSTGNIGHCKVLRNRNKEAQNVYYMEAFNSYRTKGWGDHLLLSNIYLQDDQAWEGVRSIMDGIHPIYQNDNARDFEDGDEITVGSKRFTVMLVFDPDGSDSYDINCFPSQWLAVEQLS